MSVLGNFCYVKLKTNLGRNVCTFVEINRPPLWRFPSFQNAAVGFGGGFNAFAGIAPPAIAPPVIAPPSIPAATDTEGEAKVRKLFPESWLWSEISAGV